MSAVLARPCIQAPGCRNSCGYGQLTRRGRRGQAHRFAYEDAYGPIPDGLVIDHICHNVDRDCAGGVTCPHRGCIEPTHLEVVTRQVNVLRGKTIAARNATRTHCPHGHEYTAENIYPRVGGGRVCLECKRQHDRVGPQS